MLQEGYRLFERSVPSDLADALIADIRARPTWHYAWPLGEAGALADWLHQFLRERGIGFREPSDFVVFNRPPGDGMRWHDDSHGNPAGQGRAFVCVYLTPTTTGRGALKIIPGSHLGGWSEFRAKCELARKLGDEWTPGKAPACEVYPDVFADHPEQQLLAVPERSVVVVDERVIHGAQVNAGPESRVMLLQWVWLDPAPR